MTMPTSVGRVELAGARAAALGELADEVFVAAADDVGLDVVEAQRFALMRSMRLERRSSSRSRYAVSGGVEVDAVDDSLEQRILLGDGTQVGGQLLADLVGELADDGPNGLVGILRLERQVEADELLVVP